MNGKFSTLLAGILLASAFSANAADVVKVSKLINGKQYVVAQDGWKNAEGSIVKLVLQQNEDGDGVIGIQGDASEYASAPKWTVVANSTNQVMKIGDKYLLGNAGAISLGEVNATKSVIAYTPETPKIEVGSATNGIKFGDPVVGQNYVDITVADGGKAAFYAESYTTDDEGYETVLTAVPGSGITKDVFIKIGDKYLAIDDMTNNNSGDVKVKMELIDLDSSKPGYYEAVKRATWIMDENGKYTSKHSAAANRALGTDSNNKFALVDAGAAVAFKFDGNTYCAQKGAALTDAAGEKAFTGEKFLDYDAETMNIEKLPEALVFEATDVVTATVTTNNYITNDQFENGGWYYVSLAASTYLNDNGNGTLSPGAIGTDESKSIWQVTVTEDATGQQMVTLKNKKSGKFATIGNTSSFPATTKPAYTLGMNLRVGAQYIGTNATADNTAANIGLHIPGNAAYTSDELNAKEDGGFTVTIATAKKDGSTDIEGLSGFDGKLKAVNESASHRVQLQDKDENYLVLDKKSTWSDGIELNGNGGQARGYKFTTVKEVDAEKHFAWFEVAYPLTNDKDSNRELVISVYAANTGGDAIGQLYVTKVADKYYLTTSKAVVGKEAWPYVTLGGASLVDLAETFAAAPTYYSIVKVDEDGNAKSVLGVTNDGKAAGWLNLGDVQTDQPEGQWYATSETDKTKLVLKNRENPNVKKEFASLYKTDKTTELRATSTIYKSGDDYMVLTATALADAKTSDGYEIWEQNDLRDQAFTLGLSTLFGNNAYLAENHEGKHQLGLVESVKEAATWKFTALTGKGKADGSVITDSVYVKNEITYWNANKKGGAGWDKKVDYLKLVPYTIVNAENGEPLWYSTANDTASYICNPSGEADRFVVKKSADGKYNFIRVVKKDGAWVLDQKMYAGFSAQYGNVQLINIYQKRENDAFVIEKAAAPEYLKLNLGDTIRIFREGAESSLLFEKGEFLGLENIYEFTKMAPAMYVDTAFVNRTGKDNYINNRYQYLLAVEPDRHQTSEECTIPGHPSHSTDITYGRYLVNLADSAVVEAKRNLHTNKYLNTEGFAKFGFVKASHANDTLVIANSVYTGTLNQKNDSIYMGKEEFNVAKFAFKVADQDTKAFRIQAGYKTYPAAAPAVGYLKWMNGFIVATADEKDGDIFNLKATDENPTANEAIAAEGVQVIAGKGAVTVQGAAGKVITVANILGQTIANQVAASDNVTIAAPAGVVVVAVEGDATKVVVK